MTNAGLIPASIQGQWAEAEALQAFYQLQQAAARDGIELAIASAWRSFDRQALIIDHKFKGLRAVLDADEKPLDISHLNADEKIAAICRFSALPGFSRHHLGTDFDIYAPNLLPQGATLKLTAGEYAKGSYFFELGQWLDDHLNNFGFVRPFTGTSVAFEPWHISFKKSADYRLKFWDKSQALTLLESSPYPWAKAAGRYAKIYWQDLMACPA